MERIRHLLEVMPDAVLVVDPEGRILEANALAGELFAAPVAELLGLPVEALIPGRLEELHQSHRRDYQRAPRQRRMGSGLEITARRRDGTEIPVDISLGPVETDEGRVIITMIRDIAEGKLAEQQLRDSEQRLEEAQRVADVGSWDWDLRSGEVTWSDQLYRIYGLEPNAFGATFDAYLDRVHPEDREHAATMIKSSMESGRPFAHEERIVRPSGEVRWLATRGHVREERGRVVGMTGICQDVTERKQVEAMKDAFLTALSHELRTPLTAVIGMGRTLMRQFDRLDDRQRIEMLSHISTNAAKLNRLLTDLLDLDRLTRGVLEPRREPTDLRELAWRVISDLPADDRPIEVEINAIIAEIDAPKVERIVENLVVNALRHTEPATPVWIRAARSANGVVLTVEDSGPGIPDELKSAVFEPFRQGTVPSHHPGTGVGLALVQQFARLHGGRAWVQDREGGGASFRVYLPEPEPWPRG